MGYPWVKRARNTPATPSAKKALSDNRKQSTLLFFERYWTYGYPGFKWCPSTTRRAKICKMERLRAGIESCMNLTRSLTISLSHYATSQCCLKVIHFQVLSQKNTNYWTTQHKRGKNCLRPQHFWLQSFVFHSRHYWLQSCFFFHCWNLRLCPRHNFIIIIISFSPHTFWGSPWIVIAAIIFLFSQSTFLAPPSTFFTAAFFSPFFNTKMLFFAVSASLSSK